MVEFLGKDKDHVVDEIDDAQAVVDEIDDAQAAAFARLYDTICERQKSREFPLVRPADLEAEEDQEAAAMSLSLIVKLEHVKV